MTLGKAGMPGNAEGFFNGVPRRKGVTWAGLPANLIGGTGAAGNTVVHNQ
jgi:hypothetical protein